MNDKIENVDIEHLILQTMDSDQNLLAIRQLEVVRKNIVTVFRFSVKALIDKACFSNIDDGCEEFVNFTATLENLLQYRIRSSKTWYLGDDKGHFWLYIKAACRRSDLRSCINNIDNIENIRSPIAKGRAFIRCALMEKRLSEYLVEALKQTSTTRRYYLPGAIMLGEDVLELCGVLLGLNSIDFGFCLKGENYDTVDCPLAISYTPYMKFKQSHESMHSDFEEMRELSCGSSLTSEDGNDNELSLSEHWPDRYNNLHKRYIAALQQKSFLEELAASQEKALQAAAITQQESCRLQREAAEQKHQYEAVIIELQAQVSRMKVINESLQQQLLMSRNTRFLMEEMEGKPGSNADSSRFAAAMAYKQDSDNHSFTGTYEQKAAAGDTRSMASVISEASVEVVGVGLSEARRQARRGEDTESMMPLTGSLADLQLDLEPGASSSAVQERESEATAVTGSFSTIANPEQITPVVSVNARAYTIAFLDSGEFSGSGEDDSTEIRGDDTAQQYIPAPDTTQQYIPAPSSIDEQLPHSGVQETDFDHRAYVLPEEAQAAATGGDLLNPSHKEYDDMSDDSKCSESEILAPESSTSDKDTSDETEVLSQDQENEIEATSNQTHDGAVEERESFREDEVKLEPEAMAKQEETVSDGEPSPKSIDKDSDGGACMVGSSVHAAAGFPTERAEDADGADGSSVVADNENTLNLRMAFNIGKGMSSEEGEKGGSNSDTGSSEGNKGTWDMLSDADHDSN